MLLMRNDDGSKGTVDELEDVEVIGETSENAEENCGRKHLNGGYVGASGEFVHTTINKKEVG